MKRSSDDSVTSLVADPRAFKTPTSWDEGPLASPTMLAESPVETAHFTFLPQHHEPGYAYPLLVWLHDQQEDVTELPEVMRHVSTRNHIAVAPQTILPQGEADWAQTPDAIAAAEEAVFQAVEEVSDLYQVHPERVFLVGSGSGGTMALRIGMQRPEYFAGAASLNGHVPRGGRPLSRINALRSFPFLLMRSSASTSYTETDLCHDLMLMHSAGCQLDIRHYEVSDQQVPRETMLADIDRWIMKLSLASC